MTTEKTVKTASVAISVVNALVAMEKAAITHRNAVCLLAMAYRSTGVEGPEYLALNSDIVSVLGKRMKIDPKEARRRANPILRMALLAFKSDLDLGATKDGKRVLPSVAAIREAAFKAMPSLKTNRGKRAGSKNKKTVEKAKASSNKAAAVNSAAGGFSDLHRFNSSTERERFYSTLTPEALTTDFKVMWALMVKKAPVALLALVKAK